MVNYSIYFKYGVNMNMYTHSFIPSYMHEWNHSFIIVVLLLLIIVNPLRLLFQGNLIRNIFEIFSRYFRVWLSSNICLVSVLCFCMPFHARIAIIAMRHACMSRQDQLAGRLDGWVHTCQTNPSFVCPFVRSLVRLFVLLSEATSHLVMSEEKKKARLTNWTRWTDRCLGYLGYTGYVLYKGIFLHNDQSIDDGWGRDQWISRSMDPSNLAIRIILLSPPNPLFLFLSFFSFFFFFFFSAG